MFRDKNSHLRILAMLVLIGSLFGVQVWSHVNAAPARQPAGLVILPTDTPVTPTFTASPTQTDTPTDTLTPTSTLIPTSTLRSSITPTLTLTPTSTIALSATPAAPNHIVISEFRTVGPLGADDEFVELYNPTGAAVNIGGWLINKSSACGSTVQTLVTIYSGTILQPGQHYLFAASSSNSSITNANQTFSPGIADTGGLALVNSGATIDQVGMCATTFYQEGTILQPIPGTSSDQSYERKPGGNTSCYDTNDNAADFALISPANPQNQNSPAVMCPGVALSSPTSTSTRTPTRSPTQTPTARPGVVVLNEFLPHPHSDWNGDGSVDVGDEYVEIINLESVAINVQGWILDTGLNSTKSFTLPDTLLQPRQIAIFFRSQTGLPLSDGGGTIRLLKPDGRISDAYTYPVVELADRTWCRLPNGTGVWGFACHPNPGGPNTSINFSSTPAILPGDSSICLLDNNVPQSMVQAECGNFGSGNANNPGEHLFWLQKRWKWDIFVE